MGKTAPSSRGRRQARDGLTIRGPHTNVRRGPFLIRVARIFSGVLLWRCTFIPPQSWRPVFSRRYFFDSHCIYVKVSLYRLRGSYRNIHSSTSFCWTLVESYRCTHEVMLLLFRNVVSCAAHSHDVDSSHGRINYSGGPYQRKAGAVFLYS